MDTYLFTFSLVDGLSGEIGFIGQPCYILFITNNPSYYLLSLLLDQCLVYQFCGIHFNKVKFTPPL